MSADVTVTIDDVRAAGLCVNGSRAWFARHGLDFRAFLREGLDAQTLLATAPIFILPISALQKEKISLREILGMVISVVGIAVLFLVH